MRCALVFGFRYLDLNENLTLNYAALDTATNGALTTTDGFGARNQFFGGQFGVRYEVALDRWNFDTSAMLAMGLMRETIRIAGATTVTNGAFGFADGTTAGGIFAEPSNIGAAQRDVFAAVPELHFKVGYTLTPAIQPYFAYNVLFLSDVARPGNQIDRNINPTQNAFFVPPGTLVGAGLPLATIHGTGLCVQGMQIGLEFRY